MTIGEREQPEDQPKGGPRAAEDDTEYGWDDKKWTVPPYKHWEAGNSDYQADERHYWRISKRAMWANVGIGIATLGSAIFAGIVAYGAYTATTQSVIEAKRQAKAAEDQVRVATDIAHRQLRAYLHPVIGNAVIDLDKNPLEWTYILKNFGLTPACHVRTSGQLFVGPILYSITPKPAVINHPFGAIEPKYCIAPQEEHPVKLILTPYRTAKFLSADEKILIEWGTATLLFAHGTIYYDDIFKEPHVTDFRTQFFGAKSGIMDWSPEGNEAQ